MARKSRLAAVDLVGSEEAGRLLGIDPSMARRYADRGLLRGLKVGRAWLFHRADVLAFRPRVVGRPAKAK